MSKKGRRWFIMRYFLTLVILLFSLTNVNSQVANDDCLNAIPLGNLPNPSNCGNAPSQNGLGSPIIFNNLTNGWRKRWF